MYVYVWYADFVLSSKYLVVGRTLYLILVCWKIFRIPEMLSTPKMQQAVAGNLIAYDAN